MLHYASLACLLLLVSAVSSHNGEWRIRDHKAGSGKHYVIAPESYDGYANFAVVEYDEPTNQSSNALIDIKVRIYNDSYKGEPKECHFKYPPRWDFKKAGVSSLNRLGGNKLVLTLFDELEDHTDLRTKILVIDVDNYCQMMYKLEFSYVAGRVLIVPSASRGKFDVFVDDPHTCRGFGARCRINYDLNRNNPNWAYRKAFNIDLDWSTVKIERLSNDEFVVRGFVADTYKIIRVKSDGTSLVIKKLHHQTRDLQFFSSGKTFCWISTHDRDNKVECEMHDEDDKMNFTTTVKFNEARELIDVRKIHDDEILLITKKKHCDGDDCWNLYSTYVRENGKITNEYELNFHCTGDQKDLMVFAAEYDDYLEKVDFYYACRNGDTYNFNMWYL